MLAALAPQLHGFRARNGKLIINHFYYRSKAQLTADFCFAVLIILINQQIISQVFIREGLNKKEFEWKTFLFLSNINKWQIALSLLKKYLFHELCFSLKPSLQFGHDLYVCWTHTDNTIAYQAFN